MNDTERRAGLLQTGSLVVFLLATVAGGCALLAGSYFLALVNAALMIVNFVIYQRTSTIIREQQDWPMRGPRI